MCACTVSGTKFKYEQTTLNDVPEAVKRVVLLNFVPDTVQAHIQVNANAYDTYTKMRETVVGYILQRNSRVHRAHQPMAIGAFDKGHGDLPILRRRT